MRDASSQMAAYPVANSCVTQIKSSQSEATIALGFGPTEEDSRQAALATVRRRLNRRQCFDLMVGG